MSLRDNQLSCQKALALSSRRDNHHPRRDRQNGHPDCRRLPIQIVALQRAIKPVVLVEDNGPIHVSKLTRKAIEARKHWLTVEWLPKYAPELNDIEVVWHDLKAHHLAHQTFADADALDRAIHAAVAALNLERTVNPLVIQRISA